MKKIKNTKNIIKGFTLIEVLGVVIILGVIFGLLFPNIMNHFKNAENSIDEATKKIIVEAAKDYMNENVDEYKINQKITYCIKIDDLLKSGLINEKQVTNLNNLNQYVKVSYSKDKTSYDVSEECVANIDNTFVLNGEKVITLKLNEHYEELGAKALDENDFDISSEVKISVYDSKGKQVDKVDTSKPQVYKITYDLNILDIYNKQIEREVRIIDDIAPVLTVDLMEDNFDDTVLVYDILSKITVTDNSGEVIIPIINTDLSLGVPGTYKVNISAQDSSGNKSTYTKEIQIFNRSLSYSAVLACSDGRTLDENGNCKYTYTNNSTKCGCKTYASCSNSACGVASYKSCETSACGNKTCRHSNCGVESYKSCSNSACGYNSCANSACGVASYNTCANSACGVASYNTCNHSLCPTYTTTECTELNYYWGYQCSNGCVCESMDANSCCGGSCPGSSGGGTVFKHWAACAATSTTTSRPPCAIKECGVASYKSCATSACGVASYKSCETSACGNKTCRHSNCGVESYKSCSNSACGYNSCSNSACGVASYNSCPNSACGCSEGNTCTLTENNYKIYTCPNGGTLNGTICEM